MQNIQISVGVGKFAVRGVISPNNCTFAPTKKCVSTSLELALWLSVLLYIHKLHTLVDIWSSEHKELFVHSKELTLGISAHSLLSSVGWWGVISELRSVPALPATCLPKRREKGVPAPPSLSQFSSKLALMCIFIWPRYPGAGPIYRLVCPWLRDGFVTGH